MAASPCTASRTASGTPSTDHELIAGNARRPHRWRAPRLPRIPTMGRFGAPFFVRQPLFLRILPEKPPALGKTTIWHALCDAESAHKPANGRHKRMNKGFAVGSRGERKDFQARAVVDLLHRRSDAGTRDRVFARTTARFLGRIRALFGPAARISPNRSGANRKALTATSWRRRLCHIPEAREETGRALNRFAGGNHT